MAGRVSPPPIVSKSTGEFFVGGRLPAEALYVERKADRDLLQKLEHGKTCFMLAPRQIGKSSLLSRTQARLRERGWQCIELNLEIFGTDSENEFFGMLMDWLAKELHISFNVTDFRTRHLSNTSAPRYQWVSFLLDVLLPARRQNLAILVDEVDLLIGRSFGATSFLDGLRLAVESANAPTDSVRSTGRPARPMLAVCLCGTALPSDLLRNDPRSLFEIGHEVHVADFSYDEFMQFAPLLETMQLPGVASLWLDAVYEQTKGHPYLSQRVFTSLRDNPPQSVSLTAANSSEATRRAVTKAVEERINELFIYTVDPYIEGIRTELEAQKDSNTYRDMLSLYWRIYLDQPSRRVDYNRNDVLQFKLLLHGLVRAELRSGTLSKSLISQLVVRNPVFARIFGKKWLVEQEPKPLSKYSERMLNYFETVASERPHLTGLGSRPSDHFALTYEESQDLLTTSVLLDQPLSKEYTLFIGRSEEVRRRRRRRRRISWIATTVVAGILIAGGAGIFYLGVENRQKDAEIAQLKQQVQRLSLQVANYIKLLERTFEINRSQNNEVRNLSKQLSQATQQRDELTHKLQDLNQQLTAAKIKNKQKSVIIQQLSALQQLIKKTDSIESGLKASVEAQKQLAGATGQQLSDLRDRIKSDNAEAERKLAELKEKGSQSSEPLSLPIEVARLVRNELASKAPYLSPAMATRLRSVIDELGLDFRELSGSVLPAVNPAGLALCPTGKSPQGFLLSAGDPGLVLWQSRPKSAPDESSAEVISHPIYSKLPMSSVVTFGGCRRGVTVSRDGRVLIFDDSRIDSAGLVLPPSPILALVPSNEGELPDGLPLVLSTHPNTLTRYFIKYDASTKDVPLRPAVNGGPLVHKQAVRSAAISPNGAAVVSAAGHELHLWDFVTGRLIDSHTLGGDIVAAAFSVYDESHTVLSADSSGEVRLWHHTPTGLKPRIAFRPWSESGLRDAVLVDQDRYVLATGHDGTLRLSDSRSGRSLLTLRLPGPPARRAEISADGTQLVVASEKTVTVYGVSDRDLLLLLCKAIHKRLGSPDAARQPLGFTEACPNL